MDRLTPSYSNRKAASSLVIYRQVYMGDEELVSAFIDATSGFSTREAGRLVKVSHTTVADWRKGTIPPLQPATRRALEAYLRERASTADEQSARDLIGDPRLIRRLVLEVEPHHVQTRQAMLETIEGAYHARGTPIPAWLVNLRREALSDS